MAQAAKERTQSPELVPLLKLVTTITITTMVTTTSHKTVGEHGLLGRNAQSPVARASRHDTESATGTTVQESELKRRNATLVIATAHLDIIAELKETGQVGLSGRLVQKHAREETEQNSEFADQALPAQVNPKSLKIAMSASHAWLLLVSRWVMREECKWTPSEISSRNRKSSNASPNSQSSRRIIALFEK